MLYSCGVKKSATSSSQKTISQKIAILKQKYQPILKDELVNSDLYLFIDKWYGVPYKFNGKDSNGIDCSHFTCQLLRDVFIDNPSFYFPSYELANKVSKIDKDQLREGDLVFFNINKNGKINHVGIYLVNERFIHASTSKGVMISSLLESYFASKISFFGRLK
jgi:lipoprotein Spr